MFKPRVFAAKSCSDDVRRRSTSGGVFWELASRVIADGGVVYGCAFDADLVARHIRCTGMEDVRRCMGSKYSQSDMGDCIRQAIADLRSGCKVLFSGTPCQIAGVRATVPQSLAEKLLLVDLVCHGASSPVLFQQHLGNIERQRGKKVVAYQHRPKNRGWGEYVELVRFSDGSVEQGTRLMGVWKEIFYREAAERPACHVCPWMLGNRPADLTIGDFWGIENTMPEFRDVLGVSLVVANTEKGLSAIYGTSLELRESDTESATKDNPNLLKPTLRPSNRNDIWESLYGHGFWVTCEKFKFFAPLWKHAYRKAKPLLRKIGWKR